MCYSTGKTTNRQLVTGNRQPNKLSLKLKTPDLRLKTYS